jgi:hypothetical protein
MKTLAKSIVVILLFFISLASLVFLPPIAEIVTKLLLTYYLQQNVSLHHARVSLDHYTVEGELDDNNSFAWDIDYTFFDDYKVLLSFKGDTHAFTPAFKTALPHIQGDFQADYRDKSALLTINARLLEGNATAEVDVEDKTYKYAIEGLDIASFLAQQEAEPYAGGTLSLRGKGVIEPPYTTDFLLRSGDLSLHEPLLSAVFPAHKHPVAGTLELRGSVDSEKLDVNAVLDTALAQLKVQQINYDLVGGDFNLAIDATNRKINALPMRELSLRAVGNYCDDLLTADAVLEADTYRLRIEELVYRHKKQRIGASYRLTTVDKTPLDLSGDTALFGTFAFEKGDLVMDLNALAMNEPLQLTLAKKKLKVISNNIPLAMLWKTALLPAYASGAFYLRADADLEEETPLWQVHLHSEGLQPERTIAKVLGSDAEIKITVDANGDKAGTITILPTIRSDFAAMEKTRIEYFPKEKHVRFKGEVKKILLPYYAAPSLTMHGDMDLKNDKLTTTLVRTPYETLALRDINWKKKPVGGRFDLSATALDRFAPLDGAYTVSASGRFETSEGLVLVDLKSKRLGPISFMKRGSTYTLSGKALPLGEIYKMTAQPALFSGELDFSLRYAGSRLQARADSKKISPTGTEGAFRAFALQTRADLVTKESVHQGKAEIKTSNESLILENIRIDSAKKMIRSEYRLDLKEMQKALVRLPEPLAGAVKADGMFELGNDQKLTLHLRGFPLPVEWHRYLDSNATVPLDTNVDAEIRRTGENVSLDGRVKTELLDIVPLKANLDLSTNDFNLRTALLTELWLKDTNLSAAGRFGPDWIRLTTAEAGSAYEELRLSDLSYIIPEQNLSVRYQLKLLASTKGATPYYSDALLKGNIETKPRLRATMESESFEGNLSALFTDETLTIDSRQFSLPALLAFTGKEGPIRKGKVDASIILGSSALLENNMSKLIGSTDISVTGLLVHGTDLDGYLEKLKATQDLSLFRNDFYKLPIFDVIGDTSASLIKKKPEETTIKNAKIKTDIYKGYIQCRDCALATEKNRVAATGVIDLPKNSFHDFYVAVLNPAGCAYFVQQIKGNLDNPKIDLAVSGIKVIGGAVGSVASNVGDAARIGTELVGKTGKFIGNIVSYVPIVGGVTDKTVTTITDAPSEATMILLPGDCTPFYNGSVSHPISEK